MNYWLVKSEPESYSWEDLKKDGRTMWNGVRNYQARNNLNKMKIGDLVFYYHSNTGKEIVGIAKVIKEQYPDPTTEDNRWVVVDIEPYKDLKNKVSLEKVKSDPKLENFKLVTHSRLSVMDVSKDDFQYIVQLSE